MDLSKPSGERLPRDRKWTLLLILKLLLPVIMGGVRCPLMPSPLVLIVCTIVGFVFTIVGLCVHVLWTRIRC